MAILVFWPGLVTNFLDKEKVIDTNKVRIEVPVEPARKDAAGNDEDDPTKALERAMKDTGAPQQK